MKPAFVFIGGTSEPGGLHVHTVDVAEALATSGHQVTIMCNSIDHFSAMIHDRRVCVEVIPERKPSDSAIRYWYKHLRNHRKAHVVLVRGKLAEGAVADLVAIRLFCRRLITMEHRSVDNPKLTPDYLRYHGRIMRWTVKRSVVVSEEIKASAINELHLQSDRIFCCLNWVDPVFSSRTPEERMRAKTQVGISPDCLVVGYHGRLAPEKRVDMLIGAFGALTPRNCESIRLVIAGEGWKRKELEKQVDTLGLRDRVLFTGWHPDPSSVIKAFDVSVLPSLAEGFPLGLMETMATGIPCIAHTMWSTMQLIEHKKNGYLANLEEPHGLVKAMEYLVGLDNSARDAMGRRASEFIQENYSRERRLPEVIKALGANCDSISGGIPTRPRNLVFVK